MAIPPRRRVGLSDTLPAIERRQIEGLRRMTPARRLAQANMLTRTTFSLSWQNFRRRHMELPEAEVQLRWCRFLYGEDLAARVAAYLDRRQG